MLEFSRGLVLIVDNKAYDGQILICGAIWADKSKRKHSYIRTTSSSAKCQYAISAYEMIPYTRAES